MTTKLLALYGLKWNPFAPDVPTEALRLTPRVENFCWRGETLAREGGVALVAGEPGVGKSVDLRLLVERLAALRDVKVALLSRPQSGVADFYRELGDLFGVPLAPHNHWAGAKALREKWHAHIDAALFRPVVVVDEALKVPNARPASWTRSSISRSLPCRRRARRRRPSAGDGGEPPAGRARAPPRRPARRAPLARRGALGRGGGRHRRRRAQVLQILPRPRPRGRRRLWHPLSAAVPGRAPRPRAPLRRRGCPASRSPAPGGHLPRRRRRARRPRRAGDHRADPAPRSRGRSRPPRRDRRRARPAPPRPRSLRAPAPDRRERLWGGRTPARLPARAAAPPPGRRRGRPSRAQGRGPRPRRAGTARLVGVSRLGRLQPLPPSRRRPAHAHRRAARRRVGRRHPPRARGRRRGARAPRDRRPSFPQRGEAAPLRRGARRAGP